MKNFILTTAILCTLFLTNCTNEQTTDDSSNPRLYLDSLNNQFRAEEQKIRENEKISNSKKVPTGTQLFTKIMAFLQENGNNVYFSKKADFTGKRYIFTDTKGNQHALWKWSNYKEIQVYSHYNGIEDQNHFFGWDIDSVSTRPFTSPVDGIWKDADAVNFAFNEFVAKKIK